MEVANTDRKVNAALIGNNAGESHAVQVAGTREFIEMLSSNLYSRPKEAMIREVLCNADDAHKEAGYTGPIEIQITDDNTLIIRDRGLGIPHDKMHLIYGTYGGSTKKKDSMATGGFGLGCKSPWSYTDAFVVSNCHGGTKTMSTMLRVSADHGGLPAIIPIANFPTEESGLEVRIDIQPSDRNELIQLIERTVHRGGMNATLNGQKLLTLEYKEGEVYKFVVDSDFGHKVMVKYGAVLYPVENRDVYEEYYYGITSYMRPRSTLILMAPADSLIISPNRENVSYLEKTEKQIWLLLREFMSEINRKATPYARQLIKKSNKKYIDTVGTYWMESLNRIGYLDSPVFDSEFYKLDTFGQVIHSRLTYNYPNELHEESLKHRFKLTKALIKGPWQTKLLKELERITTLDDPDADKYGPGKNKFFRFVCNELSKIVVREGWDLTKMRFGEKQQMYFGHRHTTAPQLLQERALKHGKGYDSQYRYLNAPVILSHTVKGITDDVTVPETYFAMVIPRNGPGALNPADVKKRLEQYGLTVIDATPDQKLAVATKKTTSSKYPVLGILRSKNMLETYNNNLPKLCQAASTDKDLWIENPKFYMKIQSRSSTYVTEPVDGSSTTYKPFQNFVPDDTAIVTTEAEVKKLIKLGAVHWAHPVYDQIAQIWADPKVRQAYAWTQGQGNNIQKANKFIKSAWYSKTFDLPAIVYDKDMINKLNLLDSYFEARWYFHQNGKLVEDSKNVIKSMLAVRKNGEPKKLWQLRKHLASSPLHSLQAIDMDRLIELDTAPNLDPKIKDKVHRIIEIIMEKS